MQRAFLSVSFVKLENIVMRKVLINQQVIAKWDFTVNSIQPLRTPKLMMQAEILVHVQKDTIVLFPLGNPFHAQRELFLMKKSLAQLVNAHLALKEATVQTQV